MISSPADADVDYLFIVLAVPTEPHTSTVGIQNTLDSGGSSDFVVRADRLTVGRAYTVSLESGSSQIGFDRECGQTISQSFTANAGHRNLKFTVYSCNQAPGGTVPRATFSGVNITVKLRRGGADGSVLHTDTHKVTVSAPALSRPPAPRSVSASTSGRTSVDVSWSPVQYAADYLVEYRRSGSSVWHTAVSRTTSTSYRVWGLSCGTHYNFRVSARGDGINHESGHGASGSASARTSSCLPVAPAPTGVGTSGVEKYQVQVDWNARSGASRYWVQYRADASSVWTTVTSSVTGTSFLVTGLDCESTYHFQVRAHGDGSSYRPTWGSFSASVSATTNTCPPLAPRPTNVVPLTPYRGHIEIAWAIPEGIAEWRIEYRETGSTGEWEVAPLTGTESILGVTDLQCEAEYDFRIRSYGDGETYRFAWSEPSEPVTQTIGDCQRPYFAFPNHDIYIDADAPVGTRVLTLAALDIDQDANHVFRATDGNQTDDGLYIFQVGATSGEVTLATDEFGDGPYRVTFTVTDREMQTDEIVVNFYVRHTYTARFELGGYSVTEGAGPVMVKMILDRPATEPISVGVSSGYGEYYVQHGDIEGTTAVVHFDIGESEKEFPIWASVDANEEDIEWGTMTIMHGQGGAVSRVEALIAENPWAVLVDVKDADLMQETVWETTMAVGSSDGLRGYFASDTDTPAGSMADDEFTWRDTTYSVEHLYTSPSEEKVRVEFDGAIPDDRSRVVLIVDEYRLPLHLANVKNATALEWRTPVGWGDGETVTVKLVQVYETPDE